MISQAELARKWGISKSAICAKVKAGMPLTTEAEAKGWVDANRKKAGKKLPEIGRAEINITQVEEPVELPPRENEKPKAKISEQTSGGRLERAKQAELAAYALLGNAAKEENVIAMRAAISLWGESKRRVSEAEIEHVRYEELSGQLIRVDIAKEVFAKWLSAIRQGLDNMANATSTRANPSDPECAKGAIQESVDQLLRTLSKAEVAFK